MPFSFGGAEERNWRIVQDLFLHVLKCFLYIPKISAPVLCLFNANSVVMLEYTPHTNPLLLNFGFLFIFLAIIVGFDLNKDIPFPLLFSALFCSKPCSQVLLL